MYLHRKYDQLPEKYCLEYHTYGKVSNKLLKQCICIENMTYGEIQFGVPHMVKCFSSGSVSCVASPKSAIFCNNKGSRLCSLVQVLCVQLIQQAHFTGQCSENYISKIYITHTFHQYRCSSLNTKQFCGKIGSECHLKPQITQHLH